MHGHCRTLPCARRGAPPTSPTPLEAIISEPGNRMHGAWDVALRKEGRASNCRSAMSSPSGTPVARSMISTRMGASHLAFSRSFTRYLGAKLTLQRRCGLCSHSEHCGSRQPRLLRRHIFVRPAWDPAGALSRAYLWTPVYDA